MEMQQVVILTEAGTLQLTSLSRHVLFHATLSLLPAHSMHMLLPKSGSRKIEDFCNELPQAVIVKNRKKTSITDSISSTNQFIPSIEILKFLERAVSVVDFTLLLEKRLLDVSGGEIDSDKLHEICWSYYEMEKQSDISIPQWFSSTCTYRLWLIFCCVQEQTLEDRLSAMTANEVIKRLVELCGYTWNEAYKYCDSSDLDFPQYLRAIASYFTKLRLEMSLTCEVIVDMVDEIVHGVLKKGYLIKKGHKRKNWKKRWFILQRNTLKYFDTRDTMSLKGQLVLNSNTEVKGISDRGKRRCIFEVTCGHTGTPFEISCDDQRSKHEWILAIKKAIELAKVMDGSMKQEDYTEYLTGFYLLKYGTPQPSLQRQDSTVRNMKYHATLKEQRKRLSGNRKKGSKNIDIGKLRANSAGEDLLSPQDEYVEMNPTQREGDFSDDDSSEAEGDSYTAVSPLSQMKTGLSRSMELLDAMAKDESGDHLAKSYSVSQSRNRRVEVGRVKLMDEADDHFSEEDSYSPEAYDEAVFLPRYSLSVKDPQLGGYIDVTKAGGQTKDTKAQGEGPGELPRPLGKVDEEVGLLTARSMTFDALGERARRSSSPNKYLTILRDDGTRSSSAEVKPPPPVPRHKNPAPDRILNTSESEPLLKFNPSTSNSGPPPPLRSRTLYRESSLPDQAPELPSRGTDTRRTGEEIIQRAATGSSTINSHHGKAKRTPPPLPPR